MYDEPDDPEPDLWNLPLWMLVVLLTVGSWVGIIWLIVKEA